MRPKIHISEGFKAGSFTVIKVMEPNTLFKCKCTCGAEYELSKPQVLDRRLRNNDRCRSCKRPRKAVVHRVDGKNKDIWPPVPEMGMNFITGKH